MIILGIETSCDETAAALVRSGKEILSNQVASQTEVHAPFGGVVPELASRRHVEVLPSIVKAALDEAQLTLSDIDAIAVTYGPGLIGSLLVGLNYAKGLSLSLGKPLVGVNHVEAHLYAALMAAPAARFPAIGLVASGGHTSLYLMKEPFSYELIGKTADDAMGEAFDKVASLLGLPYPGGPAVEQLAKNGDRNRFPLKMGQIKGRPFDFSFSGIKTGVLYLIKELQEKGEIDESTRASVAASFQYRACLDVVKKSLKAAKTYNAKSLIVGGGVSHNTALRQLFHEQSDGLSLLFAPPSLCMDNGAMIAALGYHRVLGGNERDPWDLDAQSSLCL